MEELQRKKKFLLNCLKSAQNDTFFAEQQDCLGGLKQIEECKKHEQFLATWLGEIQTQIDEENKG